jgi:hypothetical protein
MGGPVSARSSSRAARRKRLAAALAVLSCLSLVASACGGPRPSAVTGRVVWRNIFGDTAGLSGAQVVVRHAGSSGPGRTTTSRGDGRYAMALGPGLYDVKIYADFGEGMPTWSGEVRVRDGEISELPLCRSSNLAMLRGPVDRRLRELARVEAERLKLARHSAAVDVMGSHAGRAHEIFDAASSLSPERAVYVVVLTGRPTRVSPDAAGVAALRGGGYLALLVSAGDLTVRARAVSTSPLSRATEAALGTPGVNGFLAN